MSQHVSTPSGHLQVFSHYGHNIINLQHIYILLHVLVTKMGFGLVIGFINRSQVVTTINYNTVTNSHFYKLLHASLLRLFPLVFNICFLTMDL
jgi:hypothetical protein